MEGWIKLHRKIRNNPIYKNSKALHCWIECLLRANHTREVVYVGRKRIVLEPGQFITGREKFAEAVNMSPTTVWFWINSFKVDSMIDIKTTNKYSIISIKNWDKYQNLDSKVDSKKTAKRQQKDTDKNNKNNKEDINNNISQKRQSRSVCPILLKEKYPHLKEYKDHSECIQFLDSIGETFRGGKKFINYPKQIFHLHKMLRAGFDFREISEAITEVSETDFYRERGWDMATVANFLEKKSMKGGE